MKSNDAGVEEGRSSVWCHSDGNMRECCGRVSTECVEPARVVLKR